jgi:L-arabinokinase
VALLRALRERAPALRVVVRSAAPAWIFSERDPRIRCEPADLDPGVVQPTGLDVDLPATLAAHERLLAHWDAAVADEADWLRAAAPALVVGDVPPLAFAAAARAGVPALAVANFSWDWIFAEWAAGDARFAPVAARYREAYAGAAGAFRLPFHGDFGAFRRVVDVPLLVNHSARSRAACRAALGVAPTDPRRLVLVSFGGFGSGHFAGARGEDLAGYLFVGLEPGAPRDFPGEWIVLRRPAPVAHEDLMQACDAVLGKAGFGTVAEALVHRTRFLYLPRANFPEVPILEAALERLGCAAPMPRSDFESGRWRPHLDALFDRPPPPPPPRSDAAPLLATRLLPALDGDTLDGDGPFDFFDSSPAGTESKESKGPSPL